MICAYNVDIDNVAIKDNLYRIGNQIFKLLPTREEGKEWVKPLETLIIELLGLSSLFPDQKELLSLVSKLEGLRAGGEDIDFMLYRRTIFEACGITNQIKDNVC